MDSGSWRPESVSFSLHCQLQFDSPDPNSSGLTTWEFTKKRHGSPYGLPIKVPPQCVWQVLSRDQDCGAFGQRPERIENKESKSIWSAEIYSMKPRRVQYQEVYHNVDRLYIYSTTNL